MKRVINNLIELDKFAEELAPLFKAGDVVSLRGDLGAGKTSLVQALGKYLGIDDYITSPTFNIINVYDGDFEINHMDLYRLEDPDELLQLDYESYFYPQGISFIEWASRGEDYLPSGMIEISIDLDGDKRLIEIHEDTKRGKEIGAGLDESFSG